MIYRLVDYGIDIDEDSEKEFTAALGPHECFICLETHFHNDITNKLNYQTMYNKTCCCDGDVHIVCLQRWYVMNASCPICRRKMYMKTSIKSPMSHSRLIYLPGSSTSLPSRSLR